MLNSSLSNSKRVAVALRELGIKRLDDESFVKKGIHLVLKRRFYVDLLTPQADALQYPEITANAELAQLHKVSVPVASVEVLLKMKTRVAPTEKDMSVECNNDIVLLQEKLKAHANT